MWALFPETEGKRVNFCQLGLTAKIFIESEVAPKIGGMSRDVKGESTLTQFTL